VRVRLAVQAPLFVDSYEAVQATGALILIDEATNATVAAGLIR
jgi:sulfate adenylyltransferase subunit 1 (EFTu-like GTPase family)